MTFRCRNSGRLMYCRANGTVGLPPLGLPRVMGAEISHDARFLRDLGRLAVYRDWSVTGRAKDMKK